MTLYGRLKRTRSVAKLLVALVAILSAGCAAGSATDERSAELRPVSWYGSRAYERAKRLWAEAQAKDATLAEYERSLRDVLRALGDAAVLEPNLPLVYSKMGDIHVDLGDAESALENYRIAYELCPDWAPAWIGFARCSLMRNDLPAAETALRGAQWAIENLEAWGAPEPPGFLETFLSAFGIPIPPAEKGRKAIDDPTLEPLDAKARVTAWMKDNLTWSLDNGALLGGAPMRISPNLGRAYMARINFLRAVAVALVPPPAPISHADVILEACTHALEFDGNHFESHLLAAEQLIVARRADQARVHLESYVADKNAMLAHYDLLIALLVRAYAEIYVDDPDAENLERPARLFSWMAEYGMKPIDGSFLEAVRDGLLALHDADAAAASSALARLDRAVCEGDGERRVRDSLRVSVAALAGRADGERRSSSNGRERTALPSRPDSHGGSES